MNTNACLSILDQGEISLEGQFLWSSNYTLLAEVNRGDTTLKAVYKPAQGERPLWDFPQATLALREVAAYLVSEAIGWQLVPPTIYRESGPLGPGSLQLFMEHDPEYHYFNFTPEDRRRMHPVVLFDIIINNADRKGGHVIRDSENHLWLIDHGVCFHQNDKLRTVLWDFSGESIPDNLRRDLRELRCKLEPGGETATALQRYLSSREITALARRIDRLLVTNIFPYPPKHTRPYPWPLV